MSSPSRIKRISAPELAARKGGDPIVVLTAYTAPTARILDSHVDCLLVGDSLGMVVYGLETTLAVSVDMMINHGAAVVRGAQHACVIVDMPFASYQESPELAYRNAARIMRETGCDGIKLEGGVAMAGTVEFLARRGIPVMGHVGLMPQSVHAYGGFRIQGKDTAAARQIIDDARAVADAGAFSLVVEGVMEPVACEITAVVPVPTIGIGASPSCDGQVRRVHPEIRPPLRRIRPRSRSGGGSLCRRRPRPPFSGSRTMFRGAESRWGRGPPTQVLTPRDAASRQRRSGRHPPGRCTQPA